MRLLWPLTLLLLCTAPAAFCRDGNVSGTVVDEYGVPVAHLTVRASPADGDFDLLLPEAKTDEEGRFVLRVMTWPKRKVRWAVYPYDESKYFPGPMLGLNGNDNVAVVETSPQLPDATVEPKLGRKSAALRGHVIDAATGRGLKAELKFAKTSDPENWLAIDAEGPFRTFVPSNESIVLTVTCPGHKRWTYPGVINVGPGEDMVVDIEMEPEPAPLVR